MATLEQLPPTPREIRFSAAPLPVIVAPLVLQDGIAEPGTCYSSAEDLIFLLKQVRCNDPTVQHIDLERSGGKKLPVAYLKALFSVLSSSKYVTRLKLAKTGVTDHVAEAVADFLRCNTSVSDLDLTKNGLTDVGCQLIAAALKKRSSRNNSYSALRRLTLDGNTQISHVGIQALCDAIPDTEIRILKLGKLTLGVAGAEAVAALLQLPECPLQKLDLRSCQLGDLGASALAAALTTNISLQFLCLSRNGIGDAAVRDFAAALRRNSKLRALDLQCNGFTDAGAAAVADCLVTSNNSLQKLKLRQCDSVSEAMKEQLLDLLLVNAHGPVLARKTKHALRSLQLEECYGDGSVVGINDSSGSSFNDESSSASSDGGGGGAERIVQEVPPAAAAAIDRSPPLAEDCVICFDRLGSECVLLPCLHRNCCSACAEKLKTCHMCRETIVKVVVPGIVVEARRRRPPSRLRVSEGSIDFTPTRNH